MATDLNGWQGTTIPESLNGVAIGLGTLRARPLFVSPTQINAELPLETPAGLQLIAVNNGEGVSDPVNILVAAVAPAIFPGAAVKASDQTLVKPDNPAKAGEVITVYPTGMGQTTPELVTGRIVPSTPLASTVPVTASMGGKDAEVISSTASPGRVGLYQVSLRVPAGFSAGDVALVLKAGSVTSNAVSVAVR